MSLLFLHNNGSVKYPAEQGWPTVKHTVRNIHCIPFQKIAYIRQMGPREEKETKWFSQREWQVKGKN